MEIRHLYISPGHSFFGNHGGNSSPSPITEVESIHCIAGRGLEGDRFLGYKPNYKGQVTFFAFEVYEALCESLHVSGKEPWVFRRNVISVGCDLNSLIGEEFEVQGVRFAGTEECRPCYWMDQAFGEGAEAALRGRGGLRARILTSGEIRLSRSQVLQPKL